MDGPQNTSVRIDKNYLQGVLTHLYRWKSLEEVRKGMKNRLLKSQLGSNLRYPYYDYAVEKVRFFWMTNLRRIMLVSIRLSLPLLK
jgi:hypothetical protein